VAPATHALGADKSAEMQRHFRLAVRAFESEQYDEAARRLEEVLKLSPNSADALALRDLAEVRFYVDALQKGPEEMRENILQLLELAAEAEKERLTDRDRIGQLVGDLSGTFEERVRIYIELVSAGRHAVPPLVQRLSDTGARDYEDFRVWASIALIRIGEEAVLPLCTALRADAVGLRQDVCFILGEIGDPRAVPYLIRAAKSDPVESVRAVATRALASIGQYAEVPEELPHVALFRHARLYYYDDPSVRRPSRFGHAVWSWSAREDRLVMQTLPGFLYNLSMARNIASEALLADPDYEPVLPLLIGTYHREVLAIKHRLALSKQDPAYRLPELAERQLRQRLGKAWGVLLTLRSAGEKHFYRALDLQLHDDRPAAAAAILDDLTLIASPELNVYPRLPQMFERLRPSVIRVRSAKPEEAPAAKAEPAEVAAEAVDREHAATTASALFPMRVHAERERIEAARPERPRTAEEAAPADRETLNYLLATARRRAEARRAMEAEELEVEAEAVAAVPVVTSPLVDALKSTDKGVRYRAAAALAHIGPARSFLAAEAVVQILGQAITEKASSTVLIVSPDDQAANRLRQLVRGSGHLPYSAATVKLALAAAHELPPKDLVVLDSRLADELATLRKDPIAAATPVVIFTADEDAAEAEELYGPDVAAVVSLRDGPETVAAVLFRAMLGSREVPKAANVSLEYARLAAGALDAIPARGSPFSRHLPAIQDALIAALDSDDEFVRVRAADALGKANATALVPRLVDLAQNPDLALRERLAYVRALGRMMTPDEPAPREVVDLLKSIHRAGDPEVRRLATEYLGSAAIPPAELEELVNEQESTEGTLPPAKPRPPERSVDDTIEDILKGLPDVDLDEGSEPESGPGPEKTQPEGFGGF